MIHPTSALLRTLCVAVLATSAANLMAADSVLSEDWQNGDIFGVLPDPDEGPLGIESAGDSVTSGRVELLYMRVVFPDDLTEQSLEEADRDMMEDVNKWYTGTSYNSFRITATITPPLLMPYTWHYYHQHIPTDDPDSPGTSLLQADAAAEASRLGYAASDYDLFTVRHRGGMFGGWTGLGGGSRTWLKATNVVVQIHEIGHAIGLPHADSWNGGDRTTLWTRDGRNGYSYQQEVVKYGDTFDVMGSGHSDGNTTPDGVISGAGQFNPIYKNQLGWLTDDWIVDIRESGAYRIYGYDYLYLLGNRDYAFRIVKNQEQTYWGSFRPAQNGNHKWLKNSLILHMDGWDGQKELNGCAWGEVTALLDTTPGSIDGKHDCGITVGRTYSDEQSDVHITCVGHVDGPQRALDVVVNLGEFQDNQDPELDLVISNKFPTQTGRITQYMIDPGEELFFQATATDPDGDALAYYWDFGDNENATENRDDMRYSWEDPGLYTVRLIVTDMKGGTASKSFGINVGLPEWPGLDKDDTLGRSVFFATGKIVDQYGDPMPNVQIRVQGADPQVWTHSNSDGSFILSGVDAGADDGVVFQLPNEAYFFGGIDNAKPEPSAIPFNFNDVTNLNYIGYKRQHVSVEVADGLCVESGDGGEFIIKRRGPIPREKADSEDFGVNNFLNRELWVRVYQGGGTASMGGDYQMEAQYWPEDDDGQTIYPLGSPSWESFRDFNDVDVRNPENPDQLRREETINDCDKNKQDWVTADRYVKFPFDIDEIRVRVRPGDDGIYEGPESVKLMVAYSPDYWSPDDENEIIIQDDDAPVTPVVAVGSRGSTYENGSKNGSFVLTRTGSIEDALTVNFSISGEAIEGVDFDTMPRTATFEPGERSILVRVRGKRDALIEGSESVVMTLEDPTNTPYNGSGDTASVTIVDEGPDDVYICVTGGPAMEKDREGNPVDGNFTVARIGDLSKPLTVQFEFLEEDDPAASPLQAAGTADFISQPRQAVTIPAGNTRASFQIRPLADGVKEGDEYITVRLTPSAHYNIVNQARARMKIIDSDLPTVTVRRSGNGNMSEGGSSELEFTRSGGDLTKSMVAYYSISGDADPGFDFNIETQSRGVVLFPPKSTGDEAGVQNITVEVQAFDDDIWEEGENLYVNLLPWAPNLGPEQMTYSVDPRADSASISIRGNDNEDTFLPLVSFDHLSSEVAEGDAGDKHVAVDVVLSEWPEGRHTWDRTGKFRYADRAMIFVDYKIIVDNREKVEHPAAIDVDFESHDSQDGNPHRGVLHDDFAVEWPYVIYPNGYDPDSLDAYKQLDDDVKEEHNITPVPFAVSTVNRAYTVLHKGTIWFPYVRRPGDHLRRTIKYTVKGDTEIEENETFLIQLYNPRNCAIAEVIQGEARHDVHVATILDDDRGRVTIDVLDAITTEGADDAARFVLRRSGTGEAIAAETRVHVEVSGTAAYHNEVEYLATGDNVVPDDIFVYNGEENMLATFTFAPGETEIPFALQAIDDPVVEVENEPLQLRVYQVEQAGDKMLSMGNEVGCTVVDNDNMLLPLISIGFDDPAQAFGSETGAPITYTLTRTGDTGTALRVMYMVSPYPVSTAIAGTDFTNPVPQLVDIPAGQVSTTITIAPIDDSLVEGTESVQVAILNDDGYLVSGSSSATGYIADDESPLPEVAVEAVRPTSMEDNPSKSGRFSFTRSGDALAAMTLEVTLGGTATNAGDYQELPAEQILFPSGVEQVVFDVFAIDDSDNEGEETVIYTIQPAEGRYVIAEAGAEAAVNIIDDDQPTVRVVAEQPKAAEQGPIAGRYRFERTGGDLGSGLTIDYSISGVSAGDITGGLNGSISFAAGATATVLDLTPVDDSESEPDEVATLTINAAGGYSVLPGDDAADVVILDNDLPRISLEVTSPEADEDGSVDAVIRFVRSGSTANAVVVRFRVSGDAEQGVDFDTLHLAGQDFGEFTIPAGAASADLVIAAIDDELVEVPEDIVIELLPAIDGSYSLGEELLTESITAEVTIVSGDVTQVWVEAVSKYTKLGVEDEAFFRFHRVGNDQGPLRVNYLVDGTAINGVDYDGLDTFADMRDGDTYVDVPVKPSDTSEPRIERDTVILIVADPARAGSYVPSNPDRDTMEILTDDELAIVTKILEDDAVESIPRIGKVKIRRLGSVVQALPLTMDLTGDAIDGEDYILTMAELIDAGGATAEDGAVSAPADQTEAISQSQLDPGVEAILLAVNPLRDGIDEGTETVAIGLIEPELGADPHYFIIGPQDMVIRIRDGLVRDLTVQVVDRGITVRSTAEYEPVIEPAEGVKLDNSRRWTFDGISSGKDYDIRFITPMEITWAAFVGWHGQEGAQQ